MLNIFRKKLDQSNYKSLDYNKNTNSKEIIKGKSITQNKSKRNEYKNIIYYPYSSKEWFSNIYSYNKSYIKSLIVYNDILNKLFRSYCNILQYRTKILFKHRRSNKNRYSANKLYVSRAELNHTNTRLLVILYTYNKQKLSIERYIRKLVTIIKTKKISVGGEIEYLKTYRNRLIHILKNKYFIFKKWNIAFFRIKNNLLKYLILNIKKRKFYLNKMPTYSIRLLKKLITLQKTVFNYAKLINFNKSKFNNLVLNLKSLGLINLMQKIYDKKVEIKLVELKSIHLNSDVFSSAVALKIRDRKNKAISILRKAILKMVKIPDLHTLITFDDNIPSMNKNNILNTIKQQIVSGVRFEASGRLTRRLTAMRAVFKYRYVGSLKNIRSSFNKKSSTMLRGYIKSNSQYTIINSKTRNGSFGLKGWVSSH